MGTYVNPDGNFEVWDKKPQGYLTSEEWLAQNPPEEPAAEPIDRASEILAELDALDRACIRPLRAIANGSAESADHEKLIELETRAADLRAELKELAVANL